MIDFAPTDDQRLMQESVAEFAKSVLAPRVRELERLRGVPEDVRRLAHEMGLGLMSVPEAHGGQGADMVTAVLLEEELGSADAGAAFALPGPGAFAHAVVELGTEAQAGRYLADFAAEDGYARFGAVAWSEPSPNPARAGFSTVATRDGDGYRLSGRKSFVTSAENAHRFVVFAQVDPAAGWDGIGAFVVERGAAGFTVGARHRTLGLDAASFGEIEINEVRVDASARLTCETGAPFTLATLRFFAKQALVVAARGVGLARTAHRLSLEHADTRVAFGKPIGHFQAVAFTLVDRLMDVDSSRWLVWTAASAWDARRGGGTDTTADLRALHATAQAVAHTLEATMRTADDCVSLHGGSGFIRDLVAEKLMRDAKQLALCCPTAEQLDQLASAVELGAPLDPGLVLPTPDAQAIFT